MQKCPKYLETFWAGFNNCIFEVTTFLGTVLATFEEN